MSRMKTLDLGQLVVGIFVRAWRHGINEMRFTWVPGGLSDLAAKRRESGVGSQVKRFFFVCTLPSTVPHTIARARFSAAWDERGPVAQQDRAGCNSHNPGAGVDPEAQGRTVETGSCQEYLLAGVASELSFFPLMGLGGRSGGNNKTYRIGNDMQCSELGPFWTKEFTRELQKRRDAAAEMAGRCKPDGDYRKQIEMAVRQMDTALAAPELLSALRAICYSKSESEEYNAISSAEALMARIGSAS